MSDNIKVVVKVRPLISREIEDKLSYQWRVKNDTLYQVDQNGKDYGPCFTFDKVYDKDTATSEVYNDVAKPIVEAAIAGFNGTIFAYGQTSSGKTYTMSGTEDSPGIIPQAVINLFDKIKQIPDRDFLVRVSYIEIYNETLKDLLDMKKIVKIHETQQGIKVDVTEQVTASPDEVLEAMKKGEANRHTGATNMNEESSRSHSIFQITIESREHMEGEEETGCVNVSQLNLVDLAGSERSGQTGATGIRFKEGTHINKSLSCLALVIKQLSEIGPNNPGKYINYRDSKLTRILQNSLGGNAKTSIVCAITPASIDETISTLQFANRAKAIKNTPEVNAVAPNTNSTMIQTLTKQLCKLQAQLENKRTLEVDNAKLQNKISTLKKFILNGFAQNSSLDLASQNRRKMQQLRRVTISTLHPITEAEDSVPAVPKFRTPSLKYNPLQLPTSSEFLPIQNAGKSSLGVLTEETDRMVTPPLLGGKPAVANDEVINLDDSDEVADPKTCSPYHKCYERTKTPPCVLRTNAEAAEKNYKDIMELTAREKMYTPNTVELLEKLEQNVKTIAKLEEEVTNLQDQSKEKDTRITELKDKITKAEEEVKAVSDAKITLENQCKSFSAKLTDCEVMYETLLNKSKRREEELLSLLDEEKSCKRSDNICKSISRELSFMDMSRDISLVNSDVESSIITNPIESESSTQINELVAELQAQLTTKNDAIMKLESNLYAEKQKIESLESSINKLHTVIDGFNRKLPQLETENNFLQSTIETLNSTIEKQKVCLENTNKDIESYNSTIQELQIQLSTKENIPNVKINDSLLDTLIANEEKFIANNENMRNIVQSFKLYVQSRNNEIDVLKSQLRDSLENKEKHIKDLTQQIENLKEQLNENIEIINRLMTNEKELSIKLVEAQDHNDSLKTQNDQNVREAHDLEEKNVELSNNIQELKTKLNDAQVQLQKQNNEIREFEESKMKLTNIIDELNSNLSNAQDQNDTLKIQNEEKTKQIDDLEVLNHKLTSIIQEKEEKNVELSNNVQELDKKLNNAQTQLQKQNDEIHELEESKMKLTNIIDELGSNLSNAQDQNDTLKIQHEEKIKQIDDLKVLNHKLTSIIQEKEAIEQEIKSKHNILSKEYDNMTQKITDLEREISEKFEHTTMLNDFSQQNSDCLLKMKLVFMKLQDIVYHLGEKVWEAPEHVDNLETVINVLIDGMNNLQIAAKKLLEERNQALANVNEIKEKLTSLEENHIAQMLASRNNLDQLQNGRDEAVKLNEDMLHKMSALKDTLVEMENLLQVKNQNIAVLEGQLNEATENSNNLRKNLDSQEKVISLLRENVTSIDTEMKLLSAVDEEAKNSLKQQIVDLTKNMEDNDTSYGEILKIKDQRIFELETRFVDIEKVLNEKHNEVAIITQRFDKAVEHKKIILRHVLEMIANLSPDSNFQNDLPAEEETLFKKIIYYLNKLSNLQNICSVQSQNVESDNSDVKIMLEQAKKDIAELTKKNIQLMHEFAALGRENHEILVGIQDEDDLSKKLTDTSELLENLNSELTAKAKEILALENKSAEWRDQFLDLQSAMQQQILHLQLENERLRSQTSESAQSSMVSNLKSPPSLSALCCRTVMERIQLDNGSHPVSLTTSKTSIEALDAMIQVNTCQCTDVTYKLNELMEENIRLKETITSKTCIEALDATIQVNTCQCSDLTHKLNKLIKENCRLTETIQELESANQALLDEQEEIRKEIHLLVEPANELQKRVFSHRTNLSTLTATTYAENKLLNSQLKVVKHHHTRYINVCQRDIPNFKTQLLELMVILKDNESFVNRHNVSLKRHSLPDVLDNNQPEENFKNESTLDGDLLMLDTNVTMASAESTLLGYDQSCLDMTQMNMIDDLTESNKTIELYTQSEWLKNYDKKLLETLQDLKKENHMYREHLETCPQNNKLSVHKVDSHSSHDTTYSSCSGSSSRESADLKINQDPSSILEDFTEFKKLKQDLEHMRTQNEQIAKKYEDLASLQLTQENLSEEIKKLQHDLDCMREEKEEIEKKYADLTLEVPSLEILVKKLSTTEQEHQTKLQEITKLTKEIVKRTEKIKELQDENDQLSTQVMESTEVDDLKKEIDSLKELNSELQQRQELTTKSVQTDVQCLDCSQCLLKDELLKSMQRKVTDPLLKLNKSLCDSERTLNKNISHAECTLRQNDIIESKDGNQTTETVLIIKNSLASDSMSMDLDQSLSEDNVFSLTKDNTTKTSGNILSDVKQPSETIFLTEKMECLKYYKEITGKDDLSYGVKLVNILESFYNNLVAKHSEEVENLCNKLRDFEDCKIQLQGQFSQLNTKCENLSKEIISKENCIENFNEVLNNIRTNIDMLHKEINNIGDEDRITRLASMFNEHVLSVLDKGFQISSSNLFESLLNVLVSKHQKKLEEAVSCYTAMQANVAKIETEFKEVNDSLVQIKAQLNEKENENDLLKAQKEKIREISNAVTLDIVQREQNILDLMKSGYAHLVDCKAIDIADVDLTLQIDASINLLFQKVKDLKKDDHSGLLSEKESLAEEINVLRNTLVQKELELKNLRNIVLEKEEELSIQKSTNEDIQAAQRDLEETILQSKQAQHTFEEKIKELHSTILEKEQAISLLESKRNQEHAGGDGNSVEFVNKIEELIKENEGLKSVNSMIVEEKHLADVELQKSGELINKYILELDKLTADILVLRETVSDNVSVIESLTLEAKTLHEQNELLKIKAEEKTQDCARLEMNIKTHEKTAEIQTRMIHRLHKQKEEDEIAIKDRDQRLDELLNKCSELHKEYEEMGDCIKASKELIEQLKNEKKTLEERVLQLETEVENNQKRRSIESIGENSRRRRHSLHGSKPLFAEDKMEDEHNKMEAVFESRANPEDLFVDCDSGHSNRSTPVRLSRGRDSLKHEASDDDPPSRPSSVLATRRRRQSIYDLHRNVVRHTPSPHDQPRILETESEACRSNSKPDSEITGLRDNLASCQRELEELKEKYRELDEECEICAQYLHEREAQCVELKKEKRDLEQQVAELNSRLKANPNASQGEFKSQFSDASVNTDEDWANLHSVVVDRMSFDAEVEKNKKLARTIEELRYKNQDLKNTLQKIMDKYSSSKEGRELEQTKSELKACQQELEELKQKYRELDEECETCAEYLKERDEQCRKLKEAKAALESKLQEYEADASSVPHAVKKKRQSLHDQNRTSAADYTDASTTTTDELLSYQVERDGSRTDTTDSSQTWEIKQLRQALDNVLVEKSALEHKLMAFHPTMYVAAGSAIVQSQQLTDVMKENQKLKKINAKLVQICKKRGKSLDSRSRDNRENEDPEQILIE